MTTASDEVALARRLAELADYTVPIALGVVAGLGVADHVRDGRPADELAMTVGCDPRALTIVLEALACCGVFAELRPGVFALTPLGELLRSDHPTSLRWICLVMAADVRAWARLGQTVRTGTAAFDSVHGHNLWSYLAAHPESNARFNRTMEALTRLELLTVTEAYDWGQFGTIVDVGGGNGTLLAGLLDRNPALRGVLFDLPHVVSSAADVLHRAGVADRCVVVAGNFFADVPSGGDAYLLKRIIYSWDDEAACRILRAVRSAVGPAGRVILLEPVRRRGDGYDIGKILDLQMMVLGGGAVRDRHELRALMAAADLELTRVIPTPMVAVVEARPVE